MHLKLERTDARIHSGNFQGHGVKGQRSLELTSSEMVNFLQIDQLFV